MVPTAQMLFRCSTLIIRVGEMPWTKIGATHYHAQLGLLDKGRANKELVVYYIGVTLLNTLGD